MWKLNPKTLEVSVPDPWGTGWVKIGRIRHASESAEKFARHWLNTYRLETYVIELESGDKSRALQLAADAKVWEDEQDVQRQSAFIEPEENPFWRTDAAW